MTAPPTCLIEACVTARDEAERAVAAGAQRLELNSTLACGGLTPSPVLVERVVRAVDVPVIAMARVAGAGPGGFRHDRRAFAWLLDEIDGVLAAGAHGVAVGVLDEHGELDAVQLERLALHVAPRTVVFHRAFDLLPDPLASLAPVIAAGVTRVLTSGGAPTAMGGRAMLGRLVAAAADRVTILAGGGVGPGSVGDLVRASGVREVHGSFRGPPAVAANDPLGFDLPETSRTLDPELLRATRRALEALN